MEETFCCESTSGRDSLFYWSFLSNHLLRAIRDWRPNQRINSPPQTVLLPASLWKLGVSWGTPPQPHLFLRAGPWWRQALSMCCLLSLLGGSLCQPLHSGAPPQGHWAGLASQHRCSLGRQGQRASFCGVSLEISSGRNSERRAKTCPCESLTCFMTFLLGKWFCFL